MLRNLFADRLARTISLSAVAAALVAAPQSVHAQDAEAAEEEELYSDQIIVTAQKVEQRALDVPITISATSGERIEELGVTDLDELSNYVPGLLIQEQSANNPGIVIRGITSDSGSAQQGPRVTLYYNGIDISRSRGSYQAIYDLERVEVIKGPQATLFGTASAVGAISLISARPREGFSGELRGGYGNFDQTLVGGFLNIGSDVELVSENGLMRWKGKVSRIGDVVNQNTQSIDLFIKIYPNQNPIFDGLYLKAIVPGKTLTDAMLLPRNAVFKNNQVYVIEQDSILRTKEINVLKTNKETVVFNGLEEHADVVYEPLANAYNNMKAYKLSDSENKLNLEVSSRQESDDSGTEKIEEKES